MAEMIVQKCIQELKQFFEIMQVTDSDLSKNNCNKKIIYLRSRKIANNAYTLKHFLNTF